MRSIEDQIRSKCVHFTGIQNESCKAGVIYHDVVVEGVGIPCLKVLNSRNLPIVKDEDCVCPKRRFPTDEEVAQQVKESDELVSRALLALAVVAEDAEKHGYGKGNGGVGSCPCPVCENGTINYSVSSYNGHRHAKCTTTDCVAFLE